MRTKRESIKRLRTLDRLQLHELSEGFVIPRKKTKGSKKTFIISMAVMIVSTILLITLTRV